MPSIGIHIGIGRRTGGEVTEEPLLEGSGYTATEISALVSSGYIPIANADELHAIETGQTRTFGSGTQWEGTYTNTGADDNYIQVADIDLTHATLTSLYGGDWYDGTKGWSILFAYNTNDFTGIYDGGNFRITNLYSRSANALESGLISGTVTATIKNIRYSGWDIINTKTNYTYIGGLVNMVRGGTYENIIGSGTVNCSGNAVGGMFGYFTTTYAKIEKCSFNGTVTGINQVGTLFGATGGNYILDVVNCYALGTVNGVDEVGGIAGQYRYQQNNVKMEFCYAAVAVNGTTNTGGLIGDRTGAEVINSYYDSAISGQSDSGVSSGAPRTTTQLKTALTAPTYVDSEIVYNGWSDYLWDFGTSDDYPTFQDRRINPVVISDFMDAWSKYAGNPFFEGEFATNELYPVGSIYDNSSYFLYGKTANTTIRMIESADGKTSWDEYDGSTGIVLNISDIPSAWLNGGARAANKFEYNTLRKVGSTYYLFFGITFNDGTSSVGYATNSDLQGDDSTWVYNSNFLIDADNNDTLSVLGFDCNYITCPDVIRVSDTYYWYAEIAHSGQRYIVYWTSPSTDWLNLTLQGILFNAGNTNYILNKEGHVLQSPRVYYYDGYYYMTFTIGGDDNVANQRDIYVARSTTPTGFSIDNWQRTPILSPNGTDTWDELRVYCHDILREQDGYWVTPKLVDGKIRMYFAGHSLSTSSYTPQNTGLPGLAELTV